MTPETVPLWGKPPLARGPQMKVGPGGVCRGGQASGLFQAGCAVMAEVAVPGSLLARAFSLFGVWLQEELPDSFI